MTSKPIEREAFDLVIPQLKAQGYRVYTEVSPQLLPKGLGNYRPDLLAIGPRKNLLVEIRQGETLGEISRTVQEFLRENPNWERKVFFFQARKSDDLQAVEEKIIIEELFRSKQLLKDGHSGPALLVAWASLEATVRNQRYSEFNRPQSPGRIVDKLAEDGTVTPNQADMLRRLLKARNSYIHGVLDVRIGYNDLRDFLAIVASLQSRAIDLF
ncbi:hypothetical protein [Tropicimonas sp. IMCC6043]|uniref:hypothetical protein n=1 Tax=Tropicimonas sp. IMCC6043 TaxID=2510645 RepID=UPI00101E0837|nr:hypothetical protein [Tropicimonas sp. IMCC6043]RYH06391.1 hypothetical protein EU800_23940 [Tropicimonas sp. IMCC6043]